MFIASSIPDVVCLILAIVVGVDGFIMVDERMDDGWWVDMDGGKMEGR